MTGTEELLLWLVRVGDDTTRQVRAALIVGDAAGLSPFVARQAHEQTGVILARVVERPHVAGLHRADLVESNSNLLAVLRGDDWLRVRFGPAAAEPVGDADANLPDHEGEAGQH